MFPDPTRWTLIRNAAGGSPADRSVFVGIYGVVIRTYLDARWRGTHLANEIDDATQDVIVDCFRTNGALGRADPGHQGGFRAYLFGVVRNVARNIERERARACKQHGDRVDLEALASKDDSVAQVFDRAWATALLRQAADLQARRAAEKGQDALRRHHLLSLRYGDNLPIRDIAKHWGVDPDWLHGQFRQARDEFRRALEDVVRDLQGGGHESVGDECRKLLQHFC